MHSLQRSGPEINPPPPTLCLVEEITHRVLNEYTDAIASLSIAAAEAPDECSGRAIRETMEKLWSYAQAHRALQAPLVDEACELGEYLSELCAQFSEASLADRGVRLAVSTEEVWMDSVRCWRVGLIIAELIRNAARHGFGGGAGEIGVALGVTWGTVVCTVSDNGSSRQHVTGGRGRRLVEALAAELGGTVEWIFAPSGCRVRLKLPNSIEPPFWGAAHPSRHFWAP
jgi:two-component sensor histidine kinase